jgi:phosphate transport system permease protein
MLRTMRNQRIQDFFFHKTTMLFALSVLAGAGRASSSR